MLFKKKKDIVKRHVEERAPEVYVIPQIPDDSIGLRVKPRFEPTNAVSPMEGPYTKDVLNVPEVDVEVDVDLVYDAFRVIRKLTPQDEIERYGERYHEFPSVDSQVDPSNYEKKPKPTYHSSGSIGLNFGVVEETPTETHSRHSYQEPNRNMSQEPVRKPNIVFSRESEEVKVNPVIDSIDVSNEIKIEQEEYIARPIPRPSEHMQVHTPVIDESIPKTIVLGKATPKVEETPTINIPPFMGNLNPVEAPQTEIILDSPAVTVETKNVYETYREPVESKVIYSDKYYDYKFPPYSLLNPVNKEITEEPSWVSEKIDIINNTLLDFGIDGEVINHTYGPSVTRYEIKLSSGINVKKILSITDNFKMNLSAKTIRIEAPIPGKSNVGIEVPNNQVRIVSFSELIHDEGFTNSSKPLNIALGLNIDGKPVYTSVAKMPHGLVAGGTGSGKSVCVNGLLISLLLRYSPEDLKMILIDPKLVELAFYEDLPHLATPVVKDPKLASETLKWACDEMERRYRAFAAVRVKDIEGFNEKIKNDPSIKKVPYLVIVIDELYDLMMTAGQDVEASIQRITQMGRASGIHLIVATQRPTTDVIKGTIKANIPCRMAFKVSQFVDSTTILDHGGAESLLGRGDMLFKADDLAVRIQGAFISEDEILRVCDYIRDNYEPDYIFTHEDLQNKVKQQYGATSTKDSEDFEVLYNVALFVIERGTCSINSIQPAFNFGFRRAQRIVDMLEEMGIVSGSKGTTGREILMTKEQVEQLFKTGE